MTTVILQPKDRHHFWRSQEYRTTKFSSAPLQRALKLHSDKVQVELQLNIYHFPMPAPLIPASLTLVLSYIVSHATFHMALDCAKSQTSHNYPHTSVNRVFSHHHVFPLDRLMCPLSTMSLFLTVSSLLTLFHP